MSDTDANGFDDALARAIFACASDAIMLADDSSHYVATNPAASVLTGFSEEELRAMSVFDITPAPSEELGRAMWSEFVRRGSMAGDYSLTRKDGSIVEVEFRAVASILPGVHLAIMRDVTAQ